ncbi:Cytochrome-c peroxidase [Adhaeribacter pallidiroseus]|uniref:Cytochrome-c peroxidase n=1 Tax=Adhaeribacter pallidiroseus TaxID=2072847 RepID=A0A369QG93_9BACT|nr:cytochrome-c peroxidase [Adhaeribacter pallidiroseus]RDC63943.1 Cytochrome-c peroxidase [Adhaeribacter pallidiroseus]
MKPLYSFALFCCLLAFSCSSTDDEDKQEEIPVPQPTPYTLSFSERFQPPTIPADNPLTEEGVLLGRRLFYEKKLSGDNTISCGSCHQQKLAFTDGKALSTGINGQSTNRSSMSLVNLAWNKTFNWAGEANSLEAQARIPIENPWKCTRTWTKPFVNSKTPERTQIFLKKPLAPVL